MIETRHIVGLDLGQVADYSALVSLRREQEFPDPVKPQGMKSVAELQQYLAQPVSHESVPTLPARYYCNIAERFERGLPPDGYPTLVENVVKLFADPKFAGQPLVIDGTGVGRPVVDLFRKANKRTAVVCSKCAGHGKFDPYPNLERELREVLCTFCQGSGKVLGGYRLVPVTITGSGANVGLGKVNVDEFGYWHVPKKELVGSVQVLLGTGRLEVESELRYAGTLVHELKSFSYKVRDTGSVSLEAWREKDHDDLVLGLALAAWYGERARQELWVR